MSEIKFSIHDALNVLDLDPREINKDKREEFQSALICVTESLGTDTAISYLYTTVARGVELPLATVAAVKVMTASGAYSDCARLINHIYSLNPADSYVSYFLGYALAAAGEFRDMSQLASQLAQTGLNEMPDTTKSRWGTLLLQFGFHREASYFIEALDSSRVADILANRLASYSQSPSISTIPVRVINLRKDHRKRRISEQVLWNAGFRNIGFHTATEATTIPSVAMYKLANKTTGSTMPTSGTAGCWLSHVSMWESIAASDSEYTVVLEDDAIPEFHCSSLESFIKSNPGFDFVWLNERMSGKSHAIGDQQHPEPIDPWRVFSIWGDARTAVGADAYLLTPPAAETLLSFAAEAGIGGHIDGLMAAWTLGHRAEPQNRIQSFLIELQRQYGTSDQIRATALSIPFFKEENFGFSSRKYEDAR